jgi:hypothetical protein
LRYFDVHLHLPSADEKGLSALLQHIESEREMVGANLILNTADEVEFVHKRLSALPPYLNVVPYFDPAAQFPHEFRRSGWFKIHPQISRITAGQIGALSEAAISARPRGLIVHCFPWGQELEFNVSLSLVISLARALPKVPVLAAHGGGYESWAFRAHCGTLQNVCYDFSVTLSYCQGSDLLRPFQRYLSHSTDRVLFGSDWPSAPASEQVAECERLAAEVGIHSEQLENIFLTNSRRLWPDVSVREQ